MEIISLGAFAILFAVICAIIANSKGLSPGKWCLIGLFLGPIGFIWVLATAKNETYLDIERVLSGSFKRCPLCAEVIKTEATVCKHCGGKQAGDISPKPTKTYWVCGRCNETTETQKNTCANCGAAKV